MKVPALFAFSTLLLAACSSNSLNPYTGQPLDGSTPARLIVTAGSPADHVTFTVKAINDRSVHVKSDIPVPAGTYRITLRIIQDANSENGSGLNTTSWKEGEVTLQTELKAGHRYRPAGTLNGLLVKARLDDLGPVAEKK